MASVEVELAALEALPVPRVRDRWRALTGKPVPRISPGLLRLAVAYEIQVRAYGGLARSTQQTLDQLAAAKTVTSPARAGMRLVREWNGKAHVVTVAEDGMILSNRLYLGEITHREHVYPGLHQPLLPRALWDQVQAVLTVKQPCGRRAEYTRSADPLAGKVTDTTGAAMTITHTTRAKVRYRYFASRGTKPGEPAVRIAAGELEAAVATRIAALFDDPLALAAAASLEVHAAQLSVLNTRCQAAAAELRSRSRGGLTTIVRTVAVGDRTLEITCDAEAIAAILDVPRVEAASPTLPLTAYVRLAKSGRVMRLIQADGTTIAKQPLTSLIKPILQARRWWAELDSGEVDISAIAKREGKCTSYISRIVRLAFLSPRVVDAILAGTQRAGVDRAMLTAPGALPASWAEQEAMMLAVKGEIARTTCGGRS